MKLQIHWSKKAFTLFVLFSCRGTLYAGESFPSLTVATQYKAETSHLNTWENSIFYDPRVSKLLQLGLGAQLSFSHSDFESIQYKFEPALLFHDSIELHMRLSRKAFLPDTTSFTHVLLYTKLRTPTLAGFTLFTKVGWYYRLWELDRATVFPVPLNTAFTEYDFALGLGITYQPGNVFFGQVQAATFDAIDIYNLNHPFAEISGGIWLTDFWTLSTYARYQIQLGFGRLDRFVMGFAMDFMTD